VTRTIERAQAELAGKVRELHSAEAAYRDAEQQRLAGHTNGASCGDLRQAVVSARVERDALTDVLQDLRQQQANAAVQLEVAQREARVAAARVAWNALVEQQVRACGRLDKSLRELAASLEVLRKLSIEQVSVGQVLGQEIRWDIVVRRIIGGWVAVHLSPVLGDLSAPQGEWREQLRSKKLLELNPFCQPIDDPVAADPAA
jgi:hypothetical protein